MQKIITKNLEIDERKVKECNAKKSVLSEQKWDNQMWKNLLKEGETDKSDHVHLIHIPSKTTIDLESKPPPGYKIKEFGPISHGKIVEELLTTAIRAYKMTATRGRNMSSMMTPITLVGVKKVTNVKLAEQFNMPISTENGKVFIECTAVCDTGADITVSDKVIRDVRGKDKLPNAEGSLQACTGKTENRRKDKLCVVTAEKKVVTLESRIVEELGQGAPDSKTFQKAVKHEFGVDAKMKERFHFITRRVIQ